jgi:hypothetical protein
MRLRLSPSVHGIGLSILLGAAAPGSGAQLGTQDAPAHIAYVEGNVLLDREGQSQPATFGLPFLPGDRVRSTAGRIEILFPDGSALHVDDYSSVELLADTLLRLTDGRILLIVAGATDPASALSFQIDTPAASAFTDGPGEYRMSVPPGLHAPDVELAVLRGWATFSTDVGSVDVGAGERSLAREGAAPSLPRAFNSARFDAFDAWSLARRGARMARVAAADHLPSGLRMYGGTLDQHGTWQYESAEGYVWYPAVSPDWRPYYRGSWASYPSFGWTWIGVDPWAWPTHHYGRWSYSRSRWYWVPGRTWSPAWVHWASAPDFVAWCPVGFDRRPAFGISITIGDPRWVVVPRKAFGFRDVRVHEQVVAHRWIPRETRLVMHDAPPASGGAGSVRTVEQEPARRVAVPRVQARGRAVPRMVQGAGTAASPRPDLPAAAASASIADRAPARARGVVRESPPSTVSQPAWSPSRGAISRAPAEQAAPAAESATGDSVGIAQRSRAVRREAFPGLGTAQVDATQPARADAPPPSRQALPRRSAPAERDSTPPAREPRSVTRRAAPVAREVAPITRQPAPVAREVAPITRQPAPVAREFAPVTREPARVRRAAPAAQEAPVAPREAPRSTARARSQGAASAPGAVEAAAPPPAGRRAPAGRSSVGRRSS